MSGAGPMGQRAGPVGSYTGDGQGAAADGDETTAKAEVGDDRAGRRFEPEAVLGLSAGPRGVAEHSSVLGKGGHEQRGEVGALGRGEGAFGDEARA